MKRTSTGRPGLAALTVGAIGVVLGVTGGAHAAGVITGKQIKDGTVTTVDVKDSNITGDDVRQFSIRPQDYDGDVTGPQGPRGEQGLTGPPGLRLVGFAASTLTEAPKKDISFAVAQCDNGVNAVAGGINVVSGSLQVLDSAPAGDPKPKAGPTWVVRVQNTTSTPASYNVWAVCAEVR